MTAARHCAVCVLYAFCARKRRLWAHCLIFFSFRSSVSCRSIVFWSKNDETDFGLTKKISVLVAVGRGRVAIPCFFFFPTSKTSLTFFFFGHRNGGHRTFRAGLGFRFGEKGNRNAGSDKRQCGAKKKKKGGHTHTRMSWSKPRFKHEDRGRFISAEFLQVKRLCLLSNWQSRTTF